MHCSRRLFGVFVSLVVGFGSVGYGTAADATATSDGQKPVPIGKPALEIEPNNDLLQATPIDFPSRIQGAIFPAKDTDAYKFHLTSNKREVLMIRFLNQAANIGPQIMSGLGGTWSGYQDDTKVILIS